MDDALYMVLLCTALGYAPADNHAGYHLSREACMERAIEVRRHHKDQVAYCYSNCGAEIEVSATGEE